MALAIVSIVIGIAGLLLPVLPGWLFFGIAALLLFPEAPLAQKVILKIEAKFPRTHRFLKFLTRDGAA